MNNTLNKKIEQVTNKTLIVGVDIGSEIHYANDFDPMIPLASDQSIQIFFPFDQRFHPSESKSYLRVTFGSKCTILSIVNQGINAVKEKASVSRVSVPFKANTFLSA